MADAFEGSHTRWRQTPVGRGKTFKRRILPGIALLAAALLVLAIAAFWFGQRSLIYHPSGAPGTPGESGLDAETVQFETEDGLRLGGWLVPPAPSVTPSGHTVIVFNGNAGNRSYRAQIARGLAARGMRTLLFDYRGYGGNPGAPSEDGLARDARASRSFLASRPEVDSTRVIYFGESLGAAVAVRLAIEQPPAVLVVRSAFSSLSAMAREHLRMPLPAWLLRDRYEAAAAIRHVKAPLLVIAGTRDRIVPLADTQRLFDAGPQPKELVTIEGADHNDEVLAEGPPVIDAVVDFVRAHP